VFAITASFLHNKNVINGDIISKVQNMKGKRFGRTIQKISGKTIKDDYGKNSKEFIDFANDMKKSMKINAAKYGLRLITFETGHYDMCGYFKDNERDFSSVLQKD
jgi:hypothetical protein